MYWIRSENDRIRIRGVIFIVYKVFGFLVRSESEPFQNPDPKLWLKQRRWIRRRIEYTLRPGGGLNLTFAKKGYFFSFGIRPVG